MSTERDELMLDSMGPSAKGGIEIKTHAGGPETSAALLLMADAMMVTLADNNAENYVEMELRASDKKQYVMTLQRKGHITPHQARVKAEEALEAAKPRTVTTVEELRALKLPAIIDSPAGGPARVDYYAGPGRQQRYVESLFADDESGDECYSPEYFATFGLPATVLHEGNRA